MVRPPTTAELVVMIREERDERRRAQLLDWYWAKAADEHGAIYRWYRDEYERLVAERRRRLERLLSRPALGAYRRRSRQEAA